MAAHLASAVLNCVLAVLIPVVLNTGPLPEVFGAGSLMPFVAHARRELRQSRR